MDYVEQVNAGLRDLIDRYATEIRAVLEDAVSRDQEPSPEDLRRKVAEAQERIAREATEIFGRPERELESKLNEIKEMMERVVLLKDVVHLTVGHGNTAVQEVTQKLLKERLKRGTLRRKLGLDQVEGEDEVLDRPTPVQES